ncbi:type I-E CRISPR-associated protein Cas6/Cse3/CasE [Magnetovirga frankeli]|uniref:type I-E CRISPR-associated protein Cas6/Cse3/CasE n=1 Tax=Magnetovirga frankeli TaxID=947516 RepID=UPI001AF9E881|nr:type I-E CRISPR-associated protein Cas6/Cse3/CasE [gamma proteobacterium SS-5]
MSRLTLLPEQAKPSQLVQVSAADGYRLHQLVWNLFEEVEGQRSFLYRQERHQGLPRLLVLSEEEPIDTKGIWDIEPKPYVPKLTTGERLAFSIRLNPVVKKRDEQGRQHRHDLVMEQKKQLEQEGIPRDQWPAQSELARRTGVQWLAQRAKTAGFELHEGELMAEEYRQHRLRKPGNSPIRLSTLDCSGLLTVTDPERLVQTLKSGLGPAKGFGCGLLLVRRVGGG